jgi:fatty acid desaturase
LQARRPTLPAARSILAASVAAPARQAEAGRDGVLRHRADRRSLALAAAHFAAIAGAFVWTPGGLAGLALTAGLGLSAFVQLISAHNAMHAPVFRRRAANRRWQLVLSLAVGYPVSAFVPVHNLSHHLHLQTARDVLRTTEVRHRSNLLNLLHHVVGATIHIHALNVAYLRAMARRRPRWFAQVLREVAAVLVVAALLVALGPLDFVRFALVPWFLGQCLIIGLGYLQHDGCDPASAHDHSRNFVGPILNWFIFDNGFHSIHHMRPALHWSLAARAHAEEVAPHIHPALDQPSILSYMWRSYLWPGRRLRYDGLPVEHAGPPVPRESWIPTSAAGVGASSGAVEG